LIDEKMSWLMELYASATGKAVWTNKSGKMESERTPGA
jgi:hypothetical protein